MEQKSNFWKSAALYGLYIGVAIVLFSVILYVAGQTFNTVLGYLTYIIYIAGLVMAQIHYRNHTLNGEISYGNAVGIGVATMLFSGIVSTLYTIIIYKVDPGLIEQFKTIQEEALIAKGLSEDQVEAAISMSMKFMSPGFMAIFGLVGSVLIGTILSLITSIFVKKQSNGDAFDEAMEEVKNEEK
jgi:hypothetical protein